MAHVISRDPVRVAAEHEAAQVVMLVNGRRDKLHDVLAERFAAWLRESGARIILADDAPFCRPRVTWPNAWANPGEERERAGAGGLALGLLLGVVSFAAGALWQWLRH